MFWITGHVTSVLSPKEKFTHTRVTNLYFTILRELDLKSSSPKSRKYRLLHVRSNCRCDKEALIVMRERNTRWTECRVLTRRSLMMALKLRFLLLMFSHPCTRIHWKRSLSPLVAARFGPGIQKLIHKAKPLKGAHGPKHCPTPVRHGKCPVRK